MKQESKKEKEAMKSGTVTAPSASTPTTQPLGGASVDRLGLSCLLAVRSAIPDKRETAEAQHNVRPAHQEPGGVEEQEREGPWQVSAAGSGSGLPVQGQGQGEEEEVWQGGASS